MKFKHVHLVAFILAVIIQAASGQTNNTSSLVTTTARPLNGTTQPMSAPPQTTQLPVNATTKAQTTMPPKMDQPSTGSTPPPITVSTKAQTTMPPKTDQPPTGTNKSPTTLPPKTEVPLTTKAAAGVAGASGTLPAATTRLPLSTIPPLNAATGNLVATCGNTTCQRAFIMSTQANKVACLKDGTISVCTDGIFKMLSSMPLSETLCSGNFNFTFMSKQYFFKDTMLYQRTTTGGYVLVPAPARFQWLSSRMRPKEGQGWFYCWWNIPGDPGKPPTPRAYYFNGTYWDLEINSTGTVNAVAQKVSQYSLPLVWVERDVEGCRDEACCWYNDLSNQTVNGTLKQVMTEYVYNGTWFVWNISKTAYELISGEFTPKMMMCAMQSSNMTFTMSTNSTKYRWFNGSIFQLSPKGLPLFKAPDNFNFRQFVETDPLASGGYYYWWQSSPMAMYRNANGDWWVNVKNGKMQMQKRPPDCPSTAPPPVSDVNFEPPCVQTDDTMRLSATLCDPTSKINTCGGGYYCQNMSAVFEMACKLGVCTPNVTAFCPIPAMNTTKLKYGSNCTKPSDCFTGICKNGVCACSNCTKVLPSLDFDWVTLQPVYKERCIPKNSTVFGLNETCDMWASVKRRECATGLTCIKCPEVYNSKFSYARCTSFRSENSKKSDDGKSTGNKNDPTSKPSCPSNFPCGYMANCTMFGATPSCVCPIGYRLHDNLKDCYGWKELKETECSATCNSGVRVKNRECDKPKGLAVECEGNTTVTSICNCNDRCIDENIEKVEKTSVLFSIPSPIVTVDLFQQYIEDDFKLTISQSVNTRCLNDSSTFEKLCCPGKAYSDDYAKLDGGDCVNNKTGVNCDAKFNNGSVFSCYLNIKNDPGSKICKAARSVASRKRRDTSFTFDQQSLVDILSDAALLASVTETVQQVDPNIPVLSASSLQAPTTTTTTTTQAPAASNNADSSGTHNYAAASSASSSSSSTTTGLPIWAYGVIGGGGGLIFIIVIVVVIVALKKQQANQNKTMPHQNGPPPRLPYDERNNQQVAYSGGHSANINNDDNNVTNSNANDSFSNDNTNNANTGNSDSLFGDQAYPSYFSKYPPSANAYRMTARSPHE